MGDNFAENKNHTLFAFCSELLQHNWFDEIQLLFGPVGHTHNGNDAVHFIHNQIAGNYVSVTPAELFNNYRHAWHDDLKRPQPIIMECQFNWTERYDKVLNRIKGFTNSARDPLYVRAFRFVKNDQTGAPEMTIKGSPSAPNWHGENSVVGAPGFRILNDVPREPPLSKRPTQFRIKEQYMKRLEGRTMLKYCEDNNRKPMFEYFVRMAKTMEVPSLGNVPMEEFKALQRYQMKRLMGYSTIEVIGVRGNVKDTFYSPSLTSAEKHGHFLELEGRSR
jgi:hypothetical protein